MKLVLMSDTHLDPPATPTGDVLVVAGDLTNSGTYDEVVMVRRWLARQPHPHKLIIAGNHDWVFQDNLPKALEALGDGRNGVTYLQDSGITLGGVKFWGSPWTPRFYDWAFQQSRGEESKARWATIPLDTDVLITHGPPFAMLDRTYSGEEAGDKDLLIRIADVQPKVHVFGHIHEGKGIKVVGGTTFVNASRAAYVVEV